MQLERGHGDAQNDNFEADYFRFQNLISPYIERLSSSPRYHSSWERECYFSRNAFANRFPDQESREAILKKLEKVVAIEQYASGLS